MTRIGLRGAILVPALVACALALGPAPASAQGGVGPISVGLEAGLPLVFGVESTYRLDPRWRIGLGIGRLSGLTAVRAEARWMIRPEIRERVVPSLIAGAEQYFLSKNGQDATPLGIHAAIGLDYYLASPVSLGIRIGALKTFGSSDGNVRVFGVENGFSTGTFNLGFRYHFG
jgi:opacity protein-like surface antigen